ncbi:hypothetical protein AC1031_002958 [Aphanomyces cochlioides]|nr:hypothetical protein AC1031_002958 [Aphanomyces cochlioides]
MFLNEYAVVFSADGPFHLIVSFMRGKTAREWTDSYAILKMGHWPLLHQATITPATMDAAAADGRMDLVTWLQKNHTHVGCTTDAMDLAAAGGHLEIVKFLHRHRTEGCTENAITFAAAGGYLDVVEYLYNSTPSTIDMTSAIRQAMEYNHKEIAEWLEKQPVRRPPLVDCIFGDDDEDIMVGVDITLMDKVVGFFLGMALFAAAR